jgi:hypothetical protein
MTLDDVWALVADSEDVDQVHAVEAGLYDLSCAVKLLRWALRDSLEGESREAFQHRARQQWQDGLGRLSAAAAEAGESASCAREARPDPGARAWADSVGFSDVASSVYVDPLSRVATERAKRLVEDDQ